MSTTPDWCFSRENDTIGTLPNKAIAFEKELANIHENVSEEDWKSTVEEWGLEEQGGFEKMLTKPSWEDFYNFKNEEHSIDLFRQTRSEIEPLKTNQLSLVKDLNTLIEENLNKVHWSLVPSLQKFTNPKSWQDKTRLDFSEYIDSLVAEVSSSPQESEEPEESDSETGITSPDIATILASIRTGLLGFRLAIGKLVPAAAIKCRSITDLTELWKQEFKKLAISLVDDQELLDKVDANNDGVITQDEIEAATSFFGPSEDDILKAQENLARLEEKTDIVAAGGAGVIIFKEQCFLLGKLGFLVDQKKKMPVPLPLPYVASLDGSESDTDVLAAEAIELVQTERNQPLHVQGEAFGFINKLAVDPSQAALFDLKPHEISSLTPHMLFYKVISDENGKDVEIPITFDTSVTSNSLAQYKKGGRGIGVGVKSFTFSYDGSDPFSAKKAISAKLSIYATSFSDLLRERGKGDKKYKYVDLALKTGKSKENSDTSTDEATKAQKENLEKLNFRLKAVVQWTAVNSNLKLIDEKVKDAIYNSAISIYLIPVIHEFDFDETGAVTFDINYQAYVEHYFADPQFDIFASATNDKIARKLVYDYFREQNCDISTGSEFSDFRQQDEAFVSSVNMSSLSSIISELRRRKKIYYFDTSKEATMQWLRSPSSKDPPPSPPKIKNNNGDKVKQMKEAATKAGDDRAKQNNAMQLSLIANSDTMLGVTFFYLSDLVSIVLGNIETSLESSDTIDSSRFFQDVVDNLNTSTEIREYVEGRTKKEKIPKLKASHEQFKKLRIVLGPMEVYPYNTSKTAEPVISCTLGDIPISLNYFLDFMAQKLLAKQITQYPLSKFIKDVINDTIRNFLNSDDCFKTNSSQKTSLNSTTILGYNTKQGTAAKDDISALILQEMAKGAEGAAVKNCLLASKVTSDLPIIKISGPRSQPRSELSIDKMINYYVFSAGRRYPDAAYAGNKTSDSSRGVFHYLLGENKGIVKNIRLDKTSAPGLKEVRFEQEGYEGLTQLREVYNANIETFLNPQTFPGTYIYVEPKGFDPTATEDLTRFGIGGYYMIIKSTHTISPGNAETQLNAAWVASKGDKTGRITTEGDGPVEREEAGEEKVNKCQVQSRSNTGNDR